MSAIFALAAAIGWGSSDYAAGAASRRLRTETVVLATHLIAALVLLPPALLWGTPIRLDLVWGVAAGLAGAGGSFMLYRGLARGTMAVVAPITAAGAAVIPALFGLVRGDAVSTTDLAGIGAALVAIVLMSMSAASADGEAAAGEDAQPLPPPTMVTRPAVALPEGEALVWRKPWLVPTLVALAVVFAAATAATPVIAALASGEPLPPGGLMTLAFAGCTLLVALAGMVVMLPVMRPPDPPARAAQSVEPPQRPSRMPAGLTDAVLSGIGFGLFFVALSHTSTEGGMWPLVAARLTSVVIFATVCAIAGFALLPAAGTRRSMLVAGVGDGGAALCFLLAAQSGQLAIAAVLSSLYPGVTVLLARVLIGERSRPAQSAGLVVAGAAVALLAIA